MASQHPVKEGSIGTVRARQKIYRSIDIDLTADAKKADEAEAILKRFSSAGRAPDDKLQKAQALVETLTAIPAARSEKKTGDESGNAPAGASEKDYKALLKGMGFQL